MAEKYFSDIPSKGIPRDRVISSRPWSSYSGGMVKNERHLREPFVKVCLGFEVGGWNSDSFTTVCVLQQLLGGGSSFSAGGPGKGMYSRLYREILNRCFPITVNRATFSKIHFRRFHWVEGAEAFVNIHANAGILGIDGACPAEYVQDMLMVIMDEFVRLSFEPVKESELQRAKNMLKSMLQMQLESRLVLCEDMARQFMTCGRRKTPEEMCREIDSVSVQDILNLAKRMILQNPSIACVGENLSKAPQYDNISGILAVYRQQLRSKGYL